MQASTLQPGSPWPRAWLSPVPCAMLCRLEQPAAAGGGGPARGLPGRAPHNPHPVPSACGQRRAVERQHQRGPVNHTPWAGWDCGAPFQRCLCVYIVGCRRGASALAKRSAELP